MKIKKFKANSMPDALKQIKSELGNNAVILNSKEIRSPGILGLFQRKQVEVTAALDDEPIISERKIQLSNSELQQPKVPQNNKQLLHVEKYSETQILNEIKHLQQLLESQSFHSENQFSADFEFLYQFLLSQEVEQKLATQIVKAMITRNKNEPVSKERMKELLREEIERLLQNTSFTGISYEKQIIQFVGPTGVGKTTTLAKIAAHCLLKDNKTVAFITADTYRIAAIEQLKTYARILDVPIEVVYSPEDYLEALKKFSHVDLIFVDTAGRNFREERYIEELQGMTILPDYPVQTFLVLALTAKSQDILDIYSQFTTLEIKQVIFTKLDETVTYGSILNLCTREQIGLAYLTNGQNVPDDMVRPTKQMISELIVSRYNNG